jgi:hypothetical protein
VSQRAARWKTRAFLEQDFRELQVILTDLGLAK